MDTSAAQANSGIDLEPDRARSSDGPAEETVEWIVTFKPVSGVIVKVEKLHSQSGERQELSTAEYGALAAMGVPVMVPSPSALDDTLPASEIAPAYYQAYYQGIYDYVRYVAGLYYQNLANDSALNNPEDPIEAQRLRLANYAAVHTPPGASTGS